MQTGTDSTHGPFDLDTMIHPDLRPFLDARPRNDWSNLSEIRKGVPRGPADPAAAKEVEVSDRIVPAGGTHGLRVRTYRPKSVPGPLPGVLWIHGGGHIAGSPESSDDLCMKLAREAGCVIVSPDYRLAPEDPYPADIDDCFAALRWMADAKANGLPVDTGRLALAGASAGGGLAAAAALKARDSGGPSIRFMMLLYPMLDCRNDTPSALQITDDRVWSHRANELAWKMYLGGMDGSVPAYASPSLAEDLSGLPAAYVLVGQIDAFRDEAIDFARRLLASGVPAELHVVPGAIHGFDRLETPLSRNAMDEYVRALKNALAN